MDRASKSSQVRTVLHHGAKFDFEQVEVRRGGGVVLRQMVRHPGAAVVLPILDVPGEPLRLILILNERFAVEQELIELPAGTLEPGEEPAACARRELIEETGYDAATLEPLCRFYTTPGMTDELMHAFVARGLQHVGQRLEADERIRVQVMPVPEVLEMADDGRIRDAKTLLTLLVAERQGLLVAAGTKEEVSGAGGLP